MATRTYRMYNEHQVRAAAGLTMAAGTVGFCYAYFAKQFVPIRTVSTFFFADFILRVTLGLDYSPTGFIARLLVARREPDMVSARPKHFAWTLGLMMSGAMTVITNLSIHGPLPRTICLVCISLMWLESVLGVCLGCELYRFMMRRGWVAKNPAMVCAGGVCQVVPDRGQAPLAYLEPVR